MSTPPTHNLSIQNYTLDELLGLFNLGRSISLEDLKRAKKQVLMLHPDKSRLAPDYFLFYKKAFDVVLQFYDNQNRQNQVVSAETTEYNPVVKGTSHHDTKRTAEQIGKAVEKMGADGFRDTFNDLFEKNMATRPDPARNQWFKEEAAAFDQMDGVNAKNMGRAFETIKQKTSGLVQYKGVQEMVSGGGVGGANFYDDGGEHDASVYVTSDPFSKLKYDDLRKVHKDQTVFAVSEADFAKVPQYGSVDQFVRARGSVSLDPMDKARASEMMDAQERAKQEQMMQRQFASNLRTMQYAEKNRTVMASFLQIDR